MEKPKIGNVFEHYFTFSEEQIKKYAELSGDTNPIHIDEKYGDASMFGKCIVHGYFSISVFSKVYGTLLYPDGHILISQEAKYLKPLFTDIKYKALFTIKEIYPEKNRVCYLNEIYDSENNELKVVGEAVLMNKNYYNW